MVIEYLSKRLKLRQWEVIQKSEVSILLKKNDVAVRFYYEETGAESVDMMISYLVPPYVHNMKYLITTTDKLGETLRQFANSVGNMSELTDIIDLMNEYMVFS